MRHNTILVGNSGIPVFHIQIYMYLYGMTFNAFAVLVDTYILKIKTVIYLKCQGKLNQRNKCNIRENSLLRSISKC